MKWTCNYCREVNPQGSYECMNCDEPDYGWPDRVYPLYRVSDGVTVGGDGELRNDNRGYWSQYSGNF